MPSVEFQAWDVAKDDLNAPPLTSRLQKLASSMLLGLQALCTKCVCLRAFVRVQGRVQFWAPVMTKRNCFVDIFCEQGPFGTSCVCHVQALLSEGAELDAKASNKKNDFFWDIWVEMMWPDQTLFNDQNDHVCWMGDAMLLSSCGWMELTCVQSTQWLHLNVEIAQFKWDQSNRSVC